MAEGAVLKIIKCLLFTVTFLICVSGIAVFAVGIYAALQKVYPIEQLLGNETYTYAAYICIAAGAAVALISALGCCGVMKEDRFKLILFFIVLLITFLILFAAGIMGFVFSNQVETKLLDAMVKSVKAYNKKSIVTNAWDKLQRDFKCCGFVYNDTKESYKIWENNVNLGNLTVPMSCCVDEEDEETCQKDPKNNVHPHDCYVVAKDFFKKNALIVGAVGLGIACFLIIGMILTCVLAKSLKR